MFNDIIYKQKGCVVMGSPLGPTMANIYFSCYKIKWLEQCLSEFKSVFYRRYVDDIFALFEWTELLSKFQAYLMYVILIFFLFEKKINGKLSFLDVEVLKFVPIGQNVMKNLISWNV